MTFGALFATAIGVGFLHTLLGPDHYLPFIVIGRARRWSFSKTSLLTLACGLAHVLSSVLIGLVGVALGAALSEVEGWEADRGSWAAWGLLAFGAVYAAWGIWRALHPKKHGHSHGHINGRLHDHVHQHAAGEAHEPVHEHGHPAPALAVEAQPASWKSLTPWVLFLIFALGPCEPLIPLFFASAVLGETSQVLAVALGYSLATLITMHILVSGFWFGLSKVRFGSFERWTHAAAGSVLVLAGVGMVFLGL